MNIIKKYIWGTIVAVFLLLISLLKMEKYKNKRKDKKIKQIHQESKIKQFEAVQDILQKERKDEKHNDSLNPNTTYKL